MVTTAAELRAFLARPWGRLRAAKDRHTAAMVAREGAAAAFEVADSLSAHAEAMGAVADEGERAADLAAAVSLRRKLDRASRRRRRAR